MARVMDTRRSRLLLAVLVLAHLVAISKQVDSGSGTSLLERWVFGALAPLQGAVAAGVRGGRGLWFSYLNLRGVREENRRLQDRAAALEAELQQRRQEAAEGARLREVLELRPHLPLDTVVAQVIARDGTPWYSTITISKGTEDGVRLNAPVVSATGVVGRVIYRGPHAARVQLLLDQQSGAGARIERSRITGVVSGQPRQGSSPGGDLVMKYVPLLADVVVGDVVITSGLDRIFPPGLVVGRVRLVKGGSGLFKEILVAPSTRFDSLEEVMVVRTPPPDDSTPEAVR